MTIAAALAAHSNAQQRPQRASSSSSLKTSLPTISETPIESFDTESEDGASSPSIASTPSLCFSRTASFDSQTFSASPVSVDSPCLIAAALPLTGAASIRRNEHLAVLLPKTLWKPDSDASRCDTFVCRRKFSLFERKHHCRKCGGIFCADCSAHTTPLLDTTHLDFLHPPRNVPISNYDSPQSPVLTSRVCEDCYVQIHGPRVAPSSASLSVPRASRSASSLSSGSNRPEARSPRRRSSTASSPHKSRRSQTSSRPSTPPTNAAPLPSLESPLGDLEFYPLRHHSSICKATGGGRWEPRPTRPWDGHRVPGGKAPYEVALEAAAEKERLRRLNPVIRDGDIQLRMPPHMEPVHWKPILTF